MNKRIIITTNDYDRLLGLLKLTSSNVAPQELVSRLKENLHEAITVDQTQIDSRVITMNSRVFLKDILSDRQSEVTLTYPKEAEPRQRKISILSEPGVVLLGKQEGDLVSWKTPGKLGRFEIVKVNYQPEANKHFNL